MRFFSILFLIALAFAQEQKSEADKRAELLGAVNVSKVHSLDEAKGSYKSPRRAMFMSLIVPGAGQFYVGGQSRYIRGTFYLAEEIALIAGLYYHSMHLYDKQVRKYRNFADVNFDIVKYDSTMYAISNSIYGEVNQEKFQSNYGSERENYCTAIYGPTGGADEKCTKFANGYNSYKYQGTSLYDPTIFYRTIASEAFILGWRDAELHPQAIANIDNGEFAQLTEGGSEYYSNYLSMRKRANDLANRQAIFLGAIILNHIVSAIDAALSARAHNNNLYEEKVSFLDNIRLNSSFTGGENFRAGTAVVYVF